MKKVKPPHPAKDLSHMSANSAMCRQEVCNELIVMPKSVRSAVPSSIGSHTKGYEDDNDGKRRPTGTDSVDHWQPS